MISIKPRVSAGDVIQAIKKALHRAAQVDAEKISVEASGGKVILRGNVRTWTEREEAERAAWGAPGVTEVKMIFGLSQSLPRSRQGTDEPLGLG